VTVGRNPDAKKLNYPNALSIIVANNPECISLLFPYSSSAALKTI
jgi:hypothetical protein